MPTTRENVLSWRGRTLVDADGDEIGTLEEIHLDAESDEPEWGVVTTGLSGTKQSFVPLGDATSTGDGIRVPFEVVLHEEEVVAEKRAVPKERVRLEKDVHTGEETVSETVRSEHVDVDDDRR